MKIAIVYWLVIFVTTTLMLYVEHDSVIEALDWTVPCAVGMVIEYFRPK